MCIVLLYTYWVVVVVACKKNIRIYYMYSWFLIVVVCTYSYYTTDETTDVNFLFIFTLAEFWRAFLLIRIPWAYIFSGWMDRSFFLSTSTYVIVLHRRIYQLIYKNIRITFFLHVYVQEQIVQGWGYIFLLKIVGMMRIVKKRRGMKGSVWVREEFCDETCLPLFST